MPGDPFYIDIFKKPSTKLMFTFFLWSRVAVFNRTWDQKRNTWQCPKGKGVVLVLQLPSMIRIGYCE